MMSPVPTPVASGSRTDIVTLMCASLFVTSTDVAETANEVRVGSPIHRRTDVTLNVAKLGMLCLSLAALRCVVPLVAQHDQMVWN
jgi:hypothetical protein